MNTLSAQSTSIHFHPFDPPKAKGRCFALMIRGTGVIGMNEAWKRQVGDKRSFRISVSEDWNHILLDDAEDRITHFNKGGNVRHEEFVREFAKNIQACSSARYVIEWSDTYQGWLGTYDKDYAARDADKIVEKAATEQIRKQRRKK